MNFNSDLSKIPLPPYPIPGLSDLIEELPQTGQSQLHNLPLHDNRHDAASKVLTTPDSVLVSQIVDAFQGTPTEHIGSQRDPSSLEGVNVQPLLPSVAPSDVYSHRNMMQIPGSLNSNLSHVAPFVTPGQSVGNPMAAIFSSDSAPNSRISSLYPGTANRPITTRPVQAVAPQPRNPQVSEKAEPTETHRSTLEEKIPGTPNIATPTQEPQQENPKICLKIKRTKKGHKEKKHSSKHSSEYGVVHSDTKPEGAGPIKLKISRLKSPSAGLHHKSSPSEQTFTVSSLTTNDNASKEESSEQKVKSNAEEPPSNPPDAHRKEPNAPQRMPEHLEKSRSSKSEKHGHKHHHHHKSSKNGGTSQPTDIQQPKAQSPYPHSSSKPQSHSPYPTTQSVPQSGQSKGREPSPFVKTSTYSPAPSKPSQIATTSTSQSGSTQQNLHTSHHMTSSVDQQQFMQHQKQLMASYASNPLAHIPYPPSFPQTSLQGQTSYSGGLWDVGKTDSRNPYQQSASLAGLSRPPSYNEALLTQQRVQNQLYQSLQQANLSHDRTSAASQQQQQLLQQQLQNQHQQQLLQKQKQQQEELQKKKQQELQKKQQEMEKRKQQELQKKKQQQELMRQQQQRELMKQKELQKQKQLHQPYLQHQADFQQKAFMQAQQQAQMQPFVHQQSHQAFLPPAPSHTSQSYTPSHADMVDPNLVMQQQPRPQPVPPKKKSVPANMETYLPPPTQIPLPPSPKPAPIQPTQQTPVAKHRKHSAQQNQAAPPSNTYSAPNYTNAPRQTTARVASAASKSKKKSSTNQHVRVKFIADAEEADIYKLKDIMYPDDTEVTCFDDLNPGDEVIAKWPMNGKMYTAIVIDPLDNTGRKFRERKPPPKPFQAQFGSSKRDKKVDGPSVVLDKLAKDNIPAGVRLSEPIPEDPKDGFHAYISMADRIKLKKRERLANEARNREGKKRKRENSSSGNLINLSSDESDADFSSPSKKRSHQSEQRKRDRRKMVEMRFSQGDGAGSFQRLLGSIQQVFDDADAVDPRVLDEAINTEKDAPVPSNLLISNSRLHELNVETAKLKTYGLLSQFPRKQLVRLMTLLEPNIRDAVRLKPLKPRGDSAEEQKWNRDCLLDRVSRSIEAAMTVMNIMTARSMPKAVYIDDVIERTVQLLRNQLTSTIYPEYDPVYKIPSQGKKKGAKELASTASTRMKRAHYKGPKNRYILQLYNKLNILLHHMVELVDIQPLTDTSILQISSLGISPFFVENVRELQLSAIRLVTSVFSKYDKHRSLILEDIFQSLARLPTSKRNLRNYRLTYADEAVDSSDEEDTSGGRRTGGGGASGNAELQYIQMMSALVLQMVHAIAHLPLPDTLEEDLSKEDQQFQHQVDEMKVITSYDTAVRTGQNFLSVFLKKCASKSEEIDYRPLFENLIHDLLATVNKPEWPASEMLLSVLGRLLVHTFSTKSTEMSLRVASLDYLGVVAAKLRRDAVTSFTDVKSVRSLLERLEDAAKHEDAENQPMEQDEEKKEEAKEEEMEEDKQLKKKKRNTVEESDDDKLTRQLQYILLGYLRRNADADPALLFAHNFYIAQWLRDVSHEFQQIQQREEKSGDAGEQMDSQSKALQASQLKKDKLMKLASSAAVATLGLAEPQLDEKEQKKLARKISEQQKKADKLAMGLTVEDAALISRHLASSRSFSKAFDCYLSYILRLKDESAVALRTRAIKCLAEVVAVDPSIMEREDIAQGVQSSLVDGSTSVREAAIDLIGRFILLKPDLVKHYYKMLTARIQDTGVSVRKRVIRILRDLCHEHPELPQLTDACVKMIRRVNDEEGIKKLVHEVFMKMWFTPADPHDTESLRKKALLITDIVAANRERGYEWIEQLFKNLIDTPTRNPQVEEACRQIVNCLVEHVIVFENEQNKQKESNAQSSEKEEETEKASEATDTAKAKERSIRLVATVQTLVQLAKIRPKLLVPHVMTLQPYLATKCDTADDVLTIHGVCRTLELAIPLMEHPSEAFLMSIEEDMMRMILTHRFHVVSAAVACLGAVILRVTHNYRLIWECFEKLCNGLNNARAMHERKPVSVFYPNNLKQLLRTLFIIGHLCKNFDFDDENLKGKSKKDVCVKDKVYDCLFYFTKLPVNQVSEEACGYSIAALGLLMIQDPNMMFRNTTRELYKTLLDPDQKSVRLKNQVLQNLQTYLQAEDVKMQQAAEASAKKAKHEEDKERLNEAEVRAAAGDPGVVEDIKEICDVSSGMASSVMQLFLKQVLQAFFHRHVMVRHAALHTVYLTLQQGLVHPVQCIPYLIAAASDPESTVHKEADQQLVELSKRYHGFVHTKALHGIRLAYQLQSFVQPSGHIVRGFIERSTPSMDDGSGANLKASCSQLYQLVRSDRKHRRALLLSLLNMFDDTIKTDLKMLVFVADNLAYFPYHTLDEPLHLISQIEVYVSVSGSNVLQGFKEALQSKKSKRAEHEARRAARLQKLEERKRRREARGDDESSDSDFSSSSSSSSMSESSDDDDDSDDDSTIASRLPLRDEAIEEFAHLSLACLLLLWLKQHLKTLFGFTDNKLHRYSPTEVNRANDKQCHRKRPDLRFEPQPALAHIDRLRRKVHCRDPEYVNAVVKQYTQFNELMNKLDPNDEDSDSDKEKTTKNTPNTSEVKAKDVEDMEESDRDTDGETKQVGTLDVIRQSTALKSKKSKTKRERGGYGDEPRAPPPQMRERAPVKYMESSSDSEEEFRGF